MIFNFNNKEINLLLLKATSWSWLLGKLLSWRIWTTSRLLPTTPVFEVYDRLPAMVHTVLFVASVLLLLILICVKRNNVILSVFIVIELFSCSLDQTRISPWEYTYLFIFFIFLVHTKKPDKIQFSIILILVFTYFFAGIGKLNSDFLRLIWDQMMLRSFLKVPHHFIAQEWVHYSGYVVGIAEAIGGIGLLFSKTKGKAALGLMVMHVFVLMMFSYLGLLVYRVLWPWNICMIIFLYLISIRERPSVNLIITNFSGWNILAVICWIILPALSFWGYWDNNLSSKLFSANTPRMIICVADTSKCKPIQRFCSKSGKIGLCAGQTTIDIQTWTIRETGVSAYQSDRTDKTTMKKLQHQYPLAGFSFTYLPR